MRNRKFVFRYLTDIVNVKIFTGGDKPVSNLLKYNIEKNDSDPYKEFIDYMLCNSE